MSPTQPPTDARTKHRSRARSASKRQRWLRRDLGYLAWTLAAGGAALAAWTLWQAGSTERVRTTVIEITEEHGSDTELGAIFEASLAVTYADKDGITRVCTPTTTGWAKLAVGDVVSVFYAPDEPQNCSLVGFGAMFGWAWLMLGAAGTALALRRELARTSRLGGRKALQVLASALFLGSLGVLVLEPLVRAWLAPPG